MEISDRIMKTSPDSTYGIVYYLAKRGLEDAGKKPTHEELMEIVKRSRQGWDAFMELSYY